MHYIWFWTFWHWSKESFRCGTVLRGPLHGIASHWDEWFRHEASEADSRAIESVGRTESGQRKFVAWLCRCWVPEANPDGNKLVARFVLGQLAQVPPFNGWSAFSSYRTSYGLKGVQAIVLTDKSLGEPDDVRNIEALLLPSDADATAGAVVAEEFHAEATDLEPPLQAAKQLLGGRGLLVFLGQWLVAGRRPYPRWFATTLFGGWIAVAGLILLLLFGPELGNRLFLTESILAGLWCGLLLVDIAVVSTVAWRAWRTGVTLRQRLENSRTRLRMNGGLTLKGGSAGLPFCLNVLSSLYRAYPKDARSSWLWQQLLRKLCSEGRFWAATGVVTAAGSIKQVVLAPKLRACLLHGRIREILTPSQPEADTARPDAPANSATNEIGKTPAAKAAVPQVKFGFAAEIGRLQLHRCGHIGRAAMVLGRFTDGWRVSANVFAIVVSIVMLVALPDLRSVLRPPPAPMAVPPSSPSPYELWVSLNTKYPEYFRVVLESDYWSNRRADVRWHTEVTPSVRAVIPFHRLTGMSAANEDDGVVWIERRRHFLTREFLPGERVGRYAVPYLSHLGHE
jgi:hypothetical protein